MASSSNNQWSNDGWANSNSNPTAETEASWKSKGWQDDRTWTVKGKQSSISKNERKQRAKDYVQYLFESVKWEKEMQARMFQRERGQMWQWATSIQNASTEQDAQMSEEATEEVASPTSIATQEQTPTCSACASLQARLDEVQAEAEIATSRMRAMEEENKTQRQLIQQQAVEKTELRESVKNLTEQNARLVMSLTAEAGARH